LKAELPFIVFEITQNCNLHCGYCYNHWKRDASATTTNTSFEQAKRSLKQLFKVARVKHISISGGEPFMVERLTELVLWLRMKKKDVSIISNGFLVNKTDLQNLSQLGINALEFPLHSHLAAHHDQMTGTKSSWQKSLDNIQSALALNMNVVSVIILSHYNHEEIEDTLAFHEQIGIRNVMINRFNIGGNGIRDLKNLNLNPDELNRALTKADAYAAKSDLRISSNVCTPMCLVKPEEYQHIRFTHCSTDYRRMPITLQINGDLRICNHSPEVFGNIFTDNLSQVFTEDLHHFHHVVPSLCRSCSKYAICLGGCRAAALQYFNQVEHADPYLEIYKDYQDNCYKSV
jgi:radical SAM protein with 4Fe4S-binding SPASM domain